MRGVYTASIKGSGVNSARTLVYVTAPATAAIEIIRAWATNGSNETNEQIECVLQRVASGAPTATTITPAKHENGDQASAATSKGNVTAADFAYTANTEIGYMGVPSLPGYYYDPLPEERPIIPPSGTIGLRLLSTPAALDLICGITYREIG